MIRSGLVSLIVNAGGGRKPKPMRSTAEGYAIRQTQQTLSMVEPIKLEPGTVDKYTNRHRSGL